uniref:ADP-ribosylation factor-like protein 14 n=1 Tax=Maylandia zebra TaxID=106582 RepID=A0A3P9DIV1_9CICH
MGQHGSKSSIEALQVLLLGLDNAGKSTLLYKLKHNTSVSTVPTIGFNVEMLEARKNRRKIAITIWDVGGQGNMRDHWPNFYQNAGAIVFVVDSADQERLNEAQRELERTLRNDELRGRPLILLANKQDVGGALNVTEMKDRFNMRKICQERDCFVQPCSASTGFGVEEAFKRVVQVVKLPSEPGAVKDNIKDTVHYLRTNTKH